MNTLTVLSLVLAVLVLGSVEAYLVVLDGNPGAVVDVDLGPVVCMGGKTGNK